jgi:hypothetical protein
MAKLSRKTIQRLGVLRALSLWQNGADGKVRLQKTLFFADKRNDPDKRLFTFKKYFLGQYSPEVSEALNALHKSTKLECHFDGPAERLSVSLPQPVREAIEKIFSRTFPAWEKTLAESFREWAYLPNREMLEKAHDDPSYTEQEFDQIIFEGSLPESVDVPIDAATAERLTDFVDENLSDFLKERLGQAMRTRNEPAGDWRKLYFEEDNPPKRTAV